MNEYEKKIEYFMLSHISHVKNPKILESTRRRRKQGEADEIIFNVDAGINKVSGFFS